MCFLRSADFHSGTQVSYRTSTLQRGPDKAILLPSYFFSSVISFYSANFLQDLLVFSLTTVLGTYGGFPPGTLVLQE